MERFDIAILGTGPAGISAAITAKIRNKKILLIGSKNLSEKINKAHKIQNYPGIPYISGKDLAKKLKNHLDLMNIEITDERVGAVYSMGDYFAISAGSKMFEADSVILATGVVLGKELVGESEFLGKGVSYCATCDAPLYKGKSVIVIGYNKQAESEAEFLSEIANKVYYFPIYREKTELSKNIEVINEIPTEIFGGLKANGVRTKTGEHTADGIFVLRDSVAPKSLVPGIEIEENHIKVNSKMETNIDGCFACGDIVGKPYQYIKSAGEGNIAALQAVSYLDKKLKQGEDKK